MRDGPAERQLSVLLCCLGSSQNYLKARGTCGEVNRWQQSELQHRAWQDGRDSAGLRCVLQEVSCMAVAGTLRGEGILICSEVDEFVFITDIVSGAVAVSRRCPAQLRTVSNGVSNFIAAALTKWEYDGPDRNLLWLILLHWLQGFGTC